MTVVFHSVAVAWEHFLLQSHLQELSEVTITTDETQISRDRIRPLRWGEMSVSAVWWVLFQCLLYCCQKYIKSLYWKANEITDWTNDEDLQHTESISSIFRFPESFMYCRSEAPNILSLDILTISRVVGGGWRQTYPLISPAFIQLSCLCVITQREITDSMCPAAC